MSETENTPEENPIIQAAAELAAPTIKLYRRLSVVNVILMVIFVGANVASAYLDHKKYRVYKLTDWELGYYQGVKNGNQFSCGSNITQSEMGTLFDKTFTRDSLNFVNK